MPQEVIIVVHLLNLGDLDSMHKLNLNNYKENKLEFSKVSLLTLIEMGFFSDLKRKKIRFNPEPLKKPIYRPQNKHITKKENLVNLHLEIVKKVDKLIAKSEKEIEKVELEPVTKRQQQTLSSGVVEIWEPSTRKTEMPAIKTELKPPGSWGELEGREEFSEVEPPAEVTSKIEQIKEDNITSWMVSAINKPSKKSSKGDKQMKIKIKNKATKKAARKNNGVTKTKKELEKTKEEIEAKKRALELAMKKEKQKELELKRKQEEKRKREKLRQVEQKKKLKEEKQKAKERELEQKRKEEEKRKQEKLRQLELKKKLRVEMKKERLKEKKVEKPVKEKKQKKTKEKKVRIFKKEKETEPEPMDTFIKEEKEPKITELDEDVEKLLPILDDLFDKLPDEVVDEFAHSEHFELYEKVILKYKNK